MIKFVCIANGKEEIIDEWFKLGNSIENIVSYCIGYINCYDRFHKREMIMRPTNQAKDGYMWWTHNHSKEWKVYDDTTGEVITLDLD